MKLQTILSRADDILKYPQRRRKRKLYKQWVERAGLPPEAVPHETDKFEGTPPEANSYEAVSHKVRRPPKAHIEPDSIATHPEVTGDMLAEIDKRQLRLRVLYVLLGACLVILAVALILLIMC